MVVLFTVCFNSQQKLYLFDDYFRFFGPCSESENFVPETINKFSTICSFIIKTKIRFLEKTEHAVRAKTLMPNGILKGCWRLKTVIVLNGLNICMGARFFRRTTIFY